MFERKRILFVFQSKIKVKFILNRKHFNKIEKLYEWPIYFMARFKFEFYFFLNMYIVENTFALLLFILSVRIWCKCGIYQWDKWNKKITVYVSLLEEYMLLVILIWTHVGSLQRFTVKFNVYFYFYYFIIKPRRKKSNCFVYIYCILIIFNKYVCCFS